MSVQTVTEDELKNAPVRAIQNAIGNGHDMVKQLIQIDDEEKALRFLFSKKKAEKENMIASMQLHGFYATADEAVQEQLRTLVRSIAKKEIREDDCLMWMRKDLRKRIALTAAATAEQQQPK